VEEKKRKYKTMCINESMEKAVAREEREMESLAEMAKLEADSDGFLFEVVNVHKKDSKLPVNLYFTCNGDIYIANHNALRVKVQTTKSEKVSAKNLSPLVFITTPNYETILDIRWVGEAPKNSEISDSDLNRIIRYVKENRDIIVKHWCGELDDKEFLNLMPSEKDYKRYTSSEGL
jgi:hypothetical protein